MPNREDEDTKYVEATLDLWLNEGILVTVEEWDTPFTLWIACAKFESLNTKLVISINEAAYEAISSLIFNSTELASWNIGIPSVIAPMTFLTLKSFIHTLR